MVKLSTSLISPRVHEKRPGTLASLGEGEGENRPFEGLVFWGWVREGLLVQAKSQTKALCSLEPWGLAPGKARASLRLVFPSQLLSLL